MSNEKSDKEMMEEALEETLSHFRADRERWNRAAEAALREAMEDEDGHEVYMVQDREVSGVVAICFDGETRQGGFMIATAFPGDLPGEPPKVASVRISDAISRAVLERLKFGHEANTR